MSVVFRVCVAATALLLLCGRLPAWQGTDIPRDRPIAAGKPLSNYALVRTPPALKDALSWTLETRRHRGSASVSALSRDGKFLATGGSDTAIRIWDAKTGAFVRALVGHDGPVSCLDWSPDDRYLVSGGSYDATARIWSSAVGLPLRVLKGHKGHVTKVAWAPDGRYVAVAGGSSGFITLWDVDRTSPVKTAETGNPITGLAWGADSQQLAVAGSQIGVRVYNPREGEAIKDFAVPTTNGTAVAWSKDGKTLVGGGGGKTFAWDTSSGKVLQEWEGAAYSVAFSPDGSKLALSDLKDVRLWDVAALDKKPLLLPQYYALSVAIAPDGDLVTSGYYTASRWKPGEKKSALDIEIAATSRLTYTSGKPLVSGLHEVNPVLWNTTTGKRIAKLEGHTGPVWNAVWSPDGKHLATASYDKTVRLWDASGKLVRTLTGHDKSVYCVAWADSQTVASGGDDGSVRVWQVGSDKGKVVWKHEGAVRALAWTKAGKTLASGGDSKFIQVGNTDSGKPREIAVLEATTSLLHAPTGKMLAVASRGGWQIANLTSGKLQASPKLPPWVVNMWGEGYRTVSAYEVPNGPAVRATLILEPEQTVVVGANGHYRVADEKKTELVAVVQTGAVQETLDLKAFAEKYRFKNNPALVKMLAK